MGFFWFGFGVWAAAVVFEYFLKNEAIVVGANNLLLWACVVTVAKVFSGCGFAASVWWGQGDRGG